MGILTAGLSNSGASFTHPIYEGYSHEDQGAHHIIMESHDDVLPIYEALSDLDIAALQGNETLLESAASNVIERVKAAFQKLWGKMKAFFETIVRYFDALTKSAADFAKKYEKQLTVKSLSNFKYKMFNYTIPEAPEKDVMDTKDLTDVEEFILEAAAGSKDKEAAKKELQELREGFEDAQDEIRGRMLGTSKADAAEFKTSLFAAFRGGAESKEDKDEISVDIRHIIEAVKGSPKLKRAVEAAKKYTDTSFNKYLKSLNTAHQKFNKDSKDNKDIDLSIISGAVGQYQKYVTFSKACTLQFFAAWIDAIKERDRTYKSVMVKAFGHNDEKDN